jgi:hypothetical protein
VDDGARVSERDARLFRSFARSLAAEDSLGPVTQVTSLLDELSLQTTSTVDLTRAVVEALREEMRMLRAVKFDEQPTRRIFLTGLGGAGKTRLPATYAGTLANSGIRPPITLFQGKWSGLGPLSAEPTCAELCTRACGQEQHPLAARWTAWRPELDVVEPEATVSDFVGCYAWHSVYMVRVALNEVYADLLIGARKKALLFVKFLCCWVARLRAHAVRARTIALGIIRLFMSHRHHHEPPDRG